MQDYISKQSSRLHTPAYEACVDGIFSAFTGFVYFVFVTSGLTAILVFF